MPNLESSPKYFRMGRPKVSDVNPTVKLAFSVFRCIEKVEIQVYQHKNQ